MKMERKKETEKEKTPKRSQLSFSYNGNQINMEELNEIAKVT